MRDLIARLRGHLYILRVRLLGPNVVIGSGLRIYKRFRICGKGLVRIGRNCRIDGIMGDNSQYVCLDTHKNDSILSIGDNARLYAARISARHQITIDDDVLIEAAGIADTDFHSLGKDRKPLQDENRARCRIAIGKRVCIGAGSGILKGVTIGDDAMIAPGSLVNRSVSSGSLVSGNPARVHKRPETESTSNQTGR